MGIQTTEIDSLATIRAVGVCLLIGFAGFGVGTLFMLLTSNALLLFGFSVFDQPSLRIVISTVTLQGLGFGSVALIYISTRNEGIDFLLLDYPKFRTLVGSAVDSSCYSLF